MPVASGQREFEPLSYRCQPKNKKLTIAFALDFLQTGNRHTLPALGKEMNPMPYSMKNLKDLLYK